MRSAAPSHTARSWPMIQINVLGLICFLIMLEGFRIQTHCSKFMAAIYLMLAIAVPIIIAEALILKSYKQPETGLDFSNGTRADIKRVAIKLLGFYASLLMIGFFYFLYREYARSFYDNWWILLKYLVPGTCILAVPYIFILDKYLVVKEDANWHAGMFVLGKRAVVDREILKNHVLGWFVKGFFLPLMFTFLIQNMDYFQHNSVAVATWEVFRGSTRNFYHGMVTLIFTIDLAYVSVGYLLTFRIFNSHIRTVEPTVLGWFVALICYQPFWKALSGSYMSYNNDNFNFDNLTASHPALMVAWGITILLLLVVYVWATVQFGIRFSNLTNRGIITSGPYKYCKHPAYVSKNLSWWLIAVPFISTEGFSEAVRNCLLLANVNLIYYLRARTEEAHLGKDPAYQAYLSHMKEHSLYSKLKRMVIRRAVTT